MDILEKLFGSAARVRMLRLFLLNPERIFDAKDVVAKSKVSPRESKRELALLEKAGLLTEKRFSKEKASGAHPKRLLSKRKVAGFQLKSDFPLLSPLKNLVVSETPLNREEVVRRLRSAGKVKFLALSGIFIDEPTSRVDILVVGDNLNKRAIERSLRAIEAEIGKELRYGVLETVEFLYRLSVYDKFVRDILDFRHDRVVDKLGVS